MVPAPGRLRLQEHRRGRGVIRPVHTLGVASDVFFEDSYFAVLAGSNLLTYKRFNYGAVLFEDGSQLFKVPCFDLKQVLNGLVIDQTAAAYPVDFNRESDAPVLTIGYGNGREFDLHGRESAAKGLILS